MQNLHGRPKSSVVHKIVEQLMISSEANGRQQWDNAGGE